MAAARVEREPAGSLDGGNWAGRTSARELRNLRREAPHGRGRAAGSPMHAQGCHWRSEWRARIFDNDSRLFVGSSIEPAFGRPVACEKVAVLLVLR